MVFQGARASNSVFQGSTSFGTTTDEDIVQFPLSTVEGRLTLSSGTPVTTADVTGAGTLYFTPYKGNRMYLYDGTRWKLYSFSEISTDLSTVLPGGIVSGNNYDVYVQDASGSLVLSVSSPWTNATTRADALALQDGVLVSSFDSAIRYVGTLRASADDMTEDSVTKRFLWNYYNRAERKLFKAFADTSHTYGTNTWRPWKASNSERVEVVIGVAEDFIDVMASALCFAPAVHEYGVIGIDVDGTATNDADLVDISITTAADFERVFSHLKHYPAAGYHYYQATEYASTTTNITFYGTFGTPSLRRNGLVGSVEG